MTKPENNEGKTEVITHAAILTTGNWPIIGKSHADCFYTGRNTGFAVSKRSHHQGFITSKGRFVDRSRAYDIALEAGQIEKSTGEILISEMLWHPQDNGKFKYDSIRGYYND